MSVSIAAPTDAMANIIDVATFVRTLSFDAMPVDVVRHSKRCLLDLIGVAAGGTRMPAASIVNTYAVTQMTSCDAGARLLFDGRRASRAGAAFAGASTTDALDAHDGHVLTKGHAGVAILPALLAAVDGALNLDPSRRPTAAALAGTLRLVRQKRRRSRGPSRFPRPPIIANGSSGSRRVSACPRVPTI